MANSSVISHHLKRKLITIRSEKYIYKCFPIILLSVLNGEYVI